MDELKALGDLDVPRATLALLSSADRFAAVSQQEYERAVRRSELLMTLPSLGKIPHPSTPEGRRLHSDESRSAVLTGLSRTFAAAAAAVICAVIAGGLLGAVHPALPWHLGKVLQATGGALALWGTLFALLGPQKTWGGGSVAERVHGFMYTLLLGFGGALALLGTLL